MMKHNEITIRNEFKPGDLGYLIYLHGDLYFKEYGYGFDFEKYVAAGMLEFYNQYDPLKDKVWICEVKKRIIGSLVLMHRPENSAQLRYFLIMPEFRGIGLGKKLMNSFMQTLKDYSYQTSYLWTVSDLFAAVSLYTRHGFKLTEKKESVSFGKKLMEQKYELKQI